jgi:branched-chain amino acid transport system substrate-binding protein
MTRRPLVSAALVGLVAVSCGTRVESSERHAAASRPRLSVSEQPVSVGPPHATSTPGSVDHDGADRAAPAGTAAPARRQAAEGPQPTTPVVVGPGGPGVALPARQPEASAGAAAAGPNGPGPLVVKPKSPVVVASVGTISGPTANSLLPDVQGAQLWVKSINQGGGLSGHLVKLIVYDDGGDPARHRAQVQEAVERHGAIAFLQQTAPFTGHAAVDYINTKRVPVIGTEGGSPWALTSPMFFPQMASGDALYLAFLASAADQAIPLGKK